MVANSNNPNKELGWLNQENWSEFVKETFPLQLFKKAQ